MNRESLYILLISCLVVFYSCEKRGETYKPSIMDVTEAVYSSVTIQPDSLYEVYASVNGIVQSVELAEGDSVSKGDLLLRISNTVPELNAQNAKLALDQAQINAGKNSSILGSIQDEIKSARLKLENDELNYTRQKSLWEKGVGSKSELERKKLAFESSSNQFKILQSKLKRTKLDLRTQLNQAAVRYQSALSSSRDFEIRSKITGRVYSLLRKEGETVSSQMPLATIGSRSDFVIEMLIDEVDITKIEIGQNIFLTLDAYGKEVFQAKVNKIYPSKDLRTQTFLIEGTFEHMPKKLYPGLTGEANIVINTRKNALAIPNELLTTDNKVNTTSGIVEILPGIKSLEYTEILSGIDSSTLLLLPE